MTTQAFTIDRALQDPNLLGAALGDPASWSTGWPYYVPSLDYRLTNSSAVRLLPSLAVVSRRRRR